MCIYLHKSKVIKTNMPKNKDLIKKLRTGNQQRVAYICGLTPQYVNLVLHEHRNNPNVIATAKEFVAAVDELTEEFKSRK